MAQKERRSGNRLYGIDLELEQNEGKIRTSEETTESHEIAREGTYLVIQCDVFFDGPENLTRMDAMYVLRCLK